MDDDDRPAVLAHARFMAERDKLSALPLAGRFADIYRANLWGADTSVSGLGSEDAATTTLRAQLPSMLRQLGVRTLLDAPCGDASWIGRVDLNGIGYIGVDIVPDLIAAVRARWGGIGAFRVADITRDPLPRADAVLCRTAWCI